MRTLLVANRGEIACRIMRTARELGIRTAAVYSDADREAQHVAMADTAVHVGPSPAAQSYLDIANLLAAADAAGADAVHPGYGFLSESAAFAEAVGNAGLTWVGPSPRTIRLMGDKQTARETAQRAGVPVVPGSRRFAVGDTDGLAAEAARVGFPLLVKAAAGGGGIGMRRVDAGDDLAAAVEAVQGAAAKAFGSGDLFLERFVPFARHVEVQVFGDGAGGAIHLHERDCSVQRRFQKVIEEAPAVAIDPALRERMHAAAVALARSTAYAGAGTVEFVVDSEAGTFFFLEMNTRLQVEHPVTEFVTGVDLVAMQLDLARGRPMPDAPLAMPPQGHAIECRLYAENPAKRFFPSPGPLMRFAMPEAAPDLRIETGYREGDRVTPFYDPLLAKIVAHGPDRAAAIARAEAALRAVSVEGIATNRDFLIACLRHPDFAAGRLDTRFVERHAADLVAVAP